MIDIYFYLTDWYDNGYRNHAVTLYKKLIEWIKKRLMVLRSIANTDHSLLDCSSENSNQDPADADDEQSNIYDTSWKAEKQQLRVLLLESYLYLARLFINTDQGQAIDYYDTSICLFFRPQDINHIIEVSLGISPLNIMQNGKSSSYRNANIGYRVLYP